LVLLIGSFYVIVWCYLTGAGTFPIRLILLLFSPGIVFASAIGAATDQQKVAEEFQSALSHYQSGRLDRAAAALEPLARELPRNFDIHELLGMVYSAQGRKQDANEHL